MPARTPPSIQTVCWHAGTGFLLFFIVTSTSVVILVVQATVEHQMFLGDARGDQTFFNLAALKTRTIAKHTCLCRHTVDYAAH